MENPQKGQTGYTTLSNRKTYKTRSVANWSISHHSMTYTWRESKGITRTWINKILLLLLFFWGVTSNTFNADQLFIQIYVFDVCKERPVINTDLYFMLPGPTTVCTCTRYIARVNTFNKDIFKLRLPWVMFREIQYYKSARVILAGVLHMLNQLRQHWPFQTDSATMHNLFWMVTSPMIPPPPPITAFNYRQQVCRTWKWPGMQILGRMALTNVFWSWNKCWDSNKNQTKKNKPKSKVTSISSHLTFSGVATGQKLPQN